MRIVVDTNVITAAFIRPLGRNRDVLRACFVGTAKPLMGAALFHEYEDVLSREHLMRKSPLASSERNELFHAFLSVCEWVRVYYLWRPNLSDEADNHVIELAVAGGADAIVTNNIRDLRYGELSFKQLQIITPVQFLKLI